MPGVSFNKVATGSKTNQNLSGNTDMDDKISLNSVNVNTGKKIQC